MPGTPLALVTSAVSAPGGSVTMSAASWLAVSRAKARVRFAAAASGAVVEFGEGDPACGAGRVGHLHAVRPRRQRDLDGGVRADQIHPLTQGAKRNV
jgi:hypothetical protein